MSKSLLFQFNQRSYLFTFRLGFSLLCLFLFTLCCLLGIWQVHRYHYKKDLMQTYTSRLNAAPVFFSPSNEPAENLQFKRINVIGDYRNELTILQQNRYYQGKVGFEVFTPLHIPGQQKLLLIDRGWIAKPNDKQLPVIEPIKEKQTLTGYIKLLNEYQFILGKNILTPNLKPIVMQKIDIDEASSVTHQTFYPFILRLDASQSHGFVRDWIITTVMPERHMAYAVQWYALALVLLIAYFGFCFERVENKENGNDNANM